MSKTKFQELSTLTKGKVQCKIKVRIIRLWRGVTRSGDPFKAFNLMLIDHKNNRIHAFVPGVCADDLEGQLLLGKVCIIKNFTVQPYKEEDKFRCLRKDIQLIFSTETLIKEIQDDGRAIAKNAFDFHDHSELDALAGQTMYLADIVGIIKFRQPLAEIVNKHGKPQKQSKFTITDGRSNVKVTFWDGFALKFEKQMLEVTEQPIIIIIASCRVGMWNDELDLSGVTSTECFLNYNHYSVAQLRKMLTKPSFKKQVFAIEKKRKVELLKVANLTTLGNEYIETEVIAHLKIISVDQSVKWFARFCTTCNTEVELVNEDWFCGKCNKLKPYPEKRFNINVRTSDETGGIEVRLGDRQIRTVVGKRVAQIIKEAAEDESFPKEVKNLAHKNFTIKFFIKDLNVENRIPIFWATDICHGFILPETDEKDQNCAMQASTTEPSTSSYHLDGMSQLNFKSPSTTNTTNN